MAKHTEVDAGNGHLVHKQYDVEKLRQDCYRLNLDYLSMMKATALVSMSTASRIYKKQEILTGVVRTAPASCLAQGALALTLSPAFGLAIPPQAEFMLAEVINGHVDPNILAQYLANLTFR